MPDDQLLVLIGCLQWFGIACLLGAAGCLAYLFVKIKLCTQTAKATLLRPAPFKAGKLQYQVNGKPYTALAPPRLYWRARWKSKTIFLLYNPKRPSQILIEDYSRKFLIYIGVLLLLLGTVLIMGSVALRILY